MNKLEKMQQYREDELEFGCGYWSVCASRECHCSESKNDEGFNEEVWDDMADAKSEYNHSLLEELNELDEYDDDDLEID